MYIVMGADTATKPSLRQAPDVMRHPIGAFRSSFVFDRLHLTRLI